MVQKIGQVTPGGGTLLQDAGYSYYYQHKDWLGSARLSSTANATHNSVVGDYAYAPYGEKYDIFGSTAQNQTMFTGDTQDVLAGMYDTPNRELQGAQQGRWLSPDPAGSGWNQYAYSTNPNSGIDPSGLVTVNPSWYLAFEEGAGGFQSLSYTDQVTGIPSASGTVGADSGSSATSSSSSSSSSPPSLCYCTDDITSGALVGTSVPLQNLDLPSSNPWLFTFEPPPLIYNPSDPLSSQAVFNQLGAMAGADEDFLLIGASPYALAATGGACAAGGTGCVAGSLVVVTLVNDFYLAVNGELEEQPANAPLTIRHDPGAEPEPPSQNPGTSAPFQGPPTPP